MKSTDTQRIAEELDDADPDLDPLTLSFVRLHDLICQLDGNSRRMETLHCSQRSNQPYGPSPI